MFINNLLYSGFVERIKKIGDSKKINKNQKNYSTYLIHHDF